MLVGSRIQRSHLDRMGDHVFTDDLAGEDFTFDRTLANGGSPGQGLVGGGYCRICATQARSVCPSSRIS